MVKGCSWGMNRPERIASHIGLHMSSFRIPSKFLPACPMKRGAKGDGPYEATASVRGLLVRLSLRRPRCSVAQVSAPAHLVRSKGMRPVPEDPYVCVSPDGSGRSFVAAEVAERQHRQPNLRKDNEKDIELAGYQGKELFEGKQRI
jgi:hypothetical protein